MSEENKEQIKNIFQSLFEAKSMYLVWKVIKYSKSKLIFPSLAEKYVEVQGTTSFFQITERACEISFVVSILHCFDKNPKSFSLYKIEKEDTEQFVKDNEDVFLKLKTLRDKRLAHREMLEENPLFPSLIELNNFFKNLQDYYNKITAKHLDSETIFDMSANQLLNEMEIMFQNIDRGEKKRIKEAENGEDFSNWEKDNNKFSSRFYEED